MKRQLVYNKWFSLPRLGKESFSELMKAKVEYDSKFGFRLTSSTNIDRAFATLSEALGEEVALASACFICDGPMEEVEGEDAHTLCASCTSNEEALDLYKMKFAKLMESL